MVEIVQWNVVCRDRLSVGVRPNETQSYNCFASSTVVKEVKLLLPAAMASKLSDGVDNIKSEWNPRVF